MHECSTACRAHESSSRVHLTSGTKLPWKAKKRDQKHETTTQLSKRPEFVLFHPGHVLEQSPLLAARGRCWRPRHVRPSSLACAHSFGAMLFWAMPHAYIHTPCRSKYTYTRTSYKHSLCRCMHVSTHEGQHLRRSRGAVHALLHLPPRSLPASMRWKMHQKVA
jgi:hypothetical protein